jgi:chromosome segregation ATPase
LRTAALELSLAQSKHAIEVVAKDEEIRKLRLSQCLLQDQVDELHEQLDEEQARVDELEEVVEGSLTSLDQHKAEAEQSRNQIRTQAREIANLKVSNSCMHGSRLTTKSTWQAELRAMENVTADSDKILSEKLALTREMSSLRPEVEHLRAQVESNQGLLAEKLALQRELSSLQLELENEKRASARVIARQGKKIEQDEELRAEIEEVRKELTEEKKDRLKAEGSLAKAEKLFEQVQGALESQQQETERVRAELEKADKQAATKRSKRDQARENELAELREELKQERSLRKKAEKASQTNKEQDAELERLQRELEQEKHARQQAEISNTTASSQGDAQTDQLRKYLDEEKRERKMAEKEYKKKTTELEGRITVLDDKLIAFRDKLRSTKEKLKDKEAELEKANAAANVKESIEVARPGKNGRKRIASVEPDMTTLGTPGDGFPAKRAKMLKRATSVSAVGETSTLSLTPFLNRKSSVAPASIIMEEDEDVEQTPTTAPKQAPKTAIRPKTKALALAASNKANAKPGARKKTKLALEVVSEEESEPYVQKESSKTASATVPLKDSEDSSSKDKTLVPKIKARKSLMNIASFAEEAAPEKKKKRKLGVSNSGLGKTLFDAEDEDELPAKPALGKGIFAARALGKLPKGAPRPISGGYNMLTEENFTFSPLKKDRRNTSFLK